MSSSDSDSTDSETFGMGGPRSYASGFDSGISMSDARRNITPSASRLRHEPKFSIDESDGPHYSRHDESCEYASEAPIKRPEVWRANSRTQDIEYLSTKYHSRPSYKEFADQISGNNNSPPFREPFRFYPPESERGQGNPPYREPFRFYPQEPERNQASSRPKLKQDNTSHLTREPPGPTPRAAHERKRIRRYRGADTDEENEEDCKHATAPYLKETRRLHVVTDQGIDGKKFYQSNSPKEEDFKTNKRFWHILGLSSKPTRSIPVADPDPLSKQHHPWGFRSPKNFAHRTPFHTEPLSKNSHPPPRRSSTNATHRTSHVHDAASKNYHSRAHRSSKNTTYPSREQQPSRPYRPSGSNRHRAPFELTPSEARVETPKSYRSGDGDYLALYDLGAAKTPKVCRQSAAPYRPQQTAIIEGALGRQGDIPIPIFPYPHSTTRCRNQSCPIKGKHEKGPYLHQGKLRERSGNIFGASNPPQEIWDAYDRIKDADQGVGGKRKDQVLARDVKLVTRFARVHFGEAIEWSTADDY